MQILISTLVYRLQAVFLQVCHCGVHSSSLLRNFAGVVSVSQIRVSATLLVLAEGNCDIRFEGENWVELCVKIQLQFKYIEFLHSFSRIASALINFKHGGRGNYV